MFFGESLPRRFFESVPRDFPQVCLCVRVCSSVVQHANRPTIQSPPGISGVQSVHAFAVYAAQADLLLVMGSSLVVHPFASLIGAHLLLPDHCLLWHQTA